MNADTMPIRRVHHGRNVKRLREMLGMKQEAVADALDMTQQNMSLLEQKDEIEDDLLEKIARILKVPVDAIKNMNDEAAVNYINTFNDKVENGPFFSSSNISCNFNPIDKIMELYEKLLKEKDEKNALLEKMVKEKK